MSDNDTKISAADPHPRKKLQLIGTWISYADAGAGDPIVFLHGNPTIVADVALAAPRNGIVEIAGPERAPFNEIVARYLRALGDRREVVRDPKALYFGGSVEERSPVPLGEARLGRIGLDEWLRRSQARA